MFGASARLSRLQRPMVSCAGGERAWVELLWCRCVHILSSSHSVNGTLFLVPIQTLRSNILARAHIGARVDSESPDSSSANT